MGETKPSRIGWWDVVRDDDEAFELRTRRAKLVAGGLVLALGLAIIAFGLALGVSLLREGKGMGWVAMLTLGAFGGVFALVGWLLVSHLETYRFDLRRRLLAYRSRFHPSQDFEAPLSSMRSVELGTATHGSTDSEGHESVSMSHHVTLELAGRPDVKIDASGSVAEALYLLERLRALPRGAGPERPTLSRGEIPAPRLLRVRRDASRTRYSWRYARLITPAGLLMFLFASLCATPALMFLYFLGAMLLGHQPAEPGALFLLGLIATPFTWAVYHLGKPLTGWSEMVLEGDRLECRSWVWGRSDRRGTGSFARDEVAGVEMESAWEGVPVLVVRTLSGRPPRLPFPLGHGHFSHDDLVWIQRQVEAWMAQGARRPEVGRLFPNQRGV